MKQLPLGFKIFLAAAVALELLSPFVTTSYGMDAQYHLNWINQFSSLIQQGIFFPRWVPTAFNGFGASTFYFYPPVTFYLAAIVHGLTGISSAMILFQIISITATVASYFTSRFLFRTMEASKVNSTLSALLYTFAPWRIAELYHRAALPTHVAYVFLPLFWIGILKVIRLQRNRTHSIVFLSASIALLALTNLPFLLVSIIAMLIVGVLERDYLKIIDFIHIAVAFLFAVALVAFHYIAAYTAAPYTAVNDIKMDHTLFRWQDYATAPELYYLAMTYLPVVGLIAALWKVRHSASIEYSALRASVAISAVVLFLEIPFFSRTMWNSFLPLQLISFNIRFYSQILLAMCVAFALAHSDGIIPWIRKIQWFWVIGAIIPAFMVIFNLHLAPHAMPVLRDADEYRPVYTQQRRVFEKSLSSNSFNLQKSVVYTPFEITPTIEQGTVNAPAISALTFHRFYWPYWHLYANGAEIPSYPDSLGRAVAILPAGNYTATWHLEQTPLETAGFWISGIAWSGLLIGTGVSFIRKRVRKRFNTP